MPRFPRAVGAFVAAGVWCVQPSAAAAAERSIEAAPKPSLRWSVTSGVLSDYRDRGITYSDRKPALQVGVGVESGTGFYSFVDGSTFRGGGERDIEVAGGIGWAGDLGAAGEIDLSAAYVGYARQTATDYVEASLGWSRPLGAVTPFAGIDYVPPQTPLRGDGERLASNLYLHAGAQWAITGTPLSLRAELGRERGSFVPAGGSKWDWQVGATASFRRVEFGLAYVDASFRRPDAEARRLGGRGLVLSASTAF